MTQADSPRPIIDLMNEAAFVIGLLADQPSAFPLSDQSIVDMRALAREIRAAMKLAVKAAALAAETEDA